MIIYEVNLQINQDIFESYYNWLLIHVKEILKFAGFSKAEIGIIQSDPNTLQRQIRVNYYIHSEKDFENYLKKQAPKMRAQAIEKFGNQFSASRRLITNTILIQ